MSCNEVPSGSCNGLVAVTNMKLSYPRGYVSRAGGSVQATVSGLVGKRFVLLTERSGVRLRFTIKNPTAGVDINCNTGELTFAGIDKHSICGRKVEVIAYADCGGLMVSATAEVEQLGAIVCNQIRLSYSGFVNHHGSIHFYSDLAPRTCLATVCIDDAPDGYSLTFGKFYFRQFGSLRACFESNEPLACYYSVYRASDVVWKPTGMTQISQYAYEAPEVDLGELLLRDTLFLGIEVRSVL